MKRLTCLVLVAVVCLLSVLPGLADNFVFGLRSGIEFGDTWETIQEKEKTLTVDPESNHAFIGTVAGYSDASCCFEFDDDGKMYTMTYLFSEDVCTSKEKMDEVYKTLYDSLVRQYGKSLKDKGETTHLIKGAAVIMFVFAALSGTDESEYSYDEWALNLGNYYVKIDLVSVPIYESYNVALSYRKYTDEEYAAVLQKQQEQAIDNDI